MKDKIEYIKNLISLQTNPDSGVNQNIAKHPNATPEIHNQLISLQTDPDSYVNQNIAKHPNYKKTEDDYIAILDSLGK